MARMRALRKQEDIDKVPAEESVLIETAEEQPKPEAEEVEIDFGAAQEAVAPKSEPAPKAEPEEDEAKTALSKRVAELEAAERTSADLMRRQQEQIAEYQRRSTQHVAEAETARKGQVQSQIDSITHAISREEERATSAKREIATARTAGDMGAEIEAQDRLADAKAEIKFLQATKAQWEQTLDAAPMPQPQPEPAADPIDQMQATPMQKQWLKTHREIMGDPRKFALLQAAHFETVSNGIQADTPAYYEHLETRLGYRKPPEPEPELEPEAEPAPRRPIPVAAPVTRNPPSPGSGRRESDTRVVLSPEQREAAKNSGVTEVEYARQLMRLNAEKRAGNYGPGQQR